MNTPVLQHDWDLKSVDFPLGVKSVVFDIGGFKGRWAKEMATRYNPHLFVFEPQIWAAEICRQELESFPHTKVFEFGLGLENGYFPMEEFETDGCTFLVGRSDRDQMGQGRMVEIFSFLHKKRIRHIDLCMMNIEGYEFRLLPHMIKHGLLEKITYLMVQFHPYGELEDNQYQELRDEIYEHMDYRFDHGQILTCWERK